MRSCLKKIEPFETRRMTPRLPAQAEPAAARRAKSSRCPARVSSANPGFVRTNHFFKNFSSEQKLKLPHLLLSQLFSKPTFFKGRGGKIRRDLD